MSEKPHFVVVANRLPVDRIVAENGDVAWGTSPGGLVTALEPVMRSQGGAWVGWHGAPDEEVAPFERHLTCSLFGGAISGSFCHQLQPAREMFVRGDCRTKRAACAWPSRTTAKSYATTRGVATLRARA